MQTAMLQMIALLDNSRHLSEELSPHLGVIAPVSGSVVFEVQEKKRTGSTQSFFSFLSTCSLTSLASFYS